MRKIDLTSATNAESPTKRNKQNKQDKNACFLLRNDTSIDRYIERKRLAFHEEWDLYVADYDD